jgi:hypothetical protein
MFSDFPVFRVRFFFFRESAERAGMSVAACINCGIRDTKRS